MRIPRHRRRRAGGRVARARRRAWRRTELPPPRDPGKVTASADAARADAEGLQEGQKCVKTIQKAVNKAKAGDTIKVAERHVPRGRQDHAAPRRATSADRQPEEAAQRRARRAEGRAGRTACWSTAPTTSGERLQGQELQGQRLLRRQRRRLHVSDLVAGTAASTASTRSTPRAAGCATPRRTTTTTRASTSGRRRRRRSRSARSSKNVVVVGQRDRLVAARTCAT